MRPGGAWYHLADGLPSAETAAASRTPSEALASHAELKTLAAAIASRARTAL